MFEDRGHCVFNDKLGVDLKSDQERVKFCYLAAHGMKESPQWQL